MLFIVRAFQSGDDDVLRDISLVAIAQHEA